MDEWAEFLKDYYKVHKVPKAKAIRLSPQFAWAHPVIKIKMEVVDEDAEFLYLRNLPIEDPESGAHNAWLAREQMEAVAIMQKERSAANFVLNVSEVYVPPPFTDRLRFVERSAGLPREGRWQLGMAVADLNGDKLPDLVLPPPRLGDGRPSVMLLAGSGASRRCCARVSRRVIVEKSRRLSFSVTTCPARPLALAFSPRLMASTRCCGTRWIVSENSK